MRVQLIARDQDGEGGAIAIIVAILSTTLIVLAAFAVDFGNAYAVKRQLSVAADAAALDAARAVATTRSGGQPILGHGQGCSAWSSDQRNAAEAAAEAAADATNAANDISGDSTVDNVDVVCIDDSRVEVTVDNSRELPTFFGSLADASGYRPARSATAAVVPTLGVGGLRPFAACDLEVDQALADPDSTFTIDISNQLGVCSSSSNGNWGLTDFNGGGRSCRETSEWTEFGYPDPVFAPDPALPTKPGNCINSLRDELAAILDEVVIFPVVRGYTSGTGGGATGRFDLVGFLTAKVCGYRANAFSGTGSCYDASKAQPYLDARVEFIQFRFVDYSVGYSGGGPTCDFTDPDCRYAILSAQLYR